jgi:hypothetical protein
VSATAIEPIGQRRTKARRLLPLLSLVAGCLWGMDMKKLPEAISRCDAVVAAFPRDPFPLNERFLLHTLNQNRRAACQDIVRANALARRPQAPPTDELLRQDLKLRLASCTRRSAPDQKRSSH